MKNSILFLSLIAFVQFLGSQKTFGQNTDSTGNAQREKLNFELSVMQNEINSQFKDLQSLGEKYGWDSKEVNELRSKIDVQNAGWLIELEEIIKNGIWHDDGELGDKLLSDLFSIIHHADSSVIEKYLPMMREIVAKSKTEGDELAVMEDQLAMLKKEKQIYGSILVTDKNTNAYFVYPLSDPDNVDKRRKAIGLDSYALYLKEYNVQWDVEQYKLDLPKYEEIENLKH